MMITVIATGLVTRLRAAHEKGAAWRPRGTGIRTRGRKRWARGAGPLGDRQPQWRFLEVPAFLPDRWTRAALCGWRGPSRATGFAGTKGTDPDVFTTSQVGTQKPPLQPRNVYFNRGEYETGGHEFEDVLGECAISSNPDHRAWRYGYAPRRGRISGWRLPRGSTRRRRGSSRRRWREPDLPRPALLRGRIFQRSSRLQEAVAELEWALAEHPRYIEALLLLAVCRSQPR